jgi:rubrerythrin
MNEKYDDPVEENEMKEPLLTAKIEAILANTLGNSGIYPRWIAVKVSPQQYWFLTFKNYKIDRFVQRKISKKKEEPQAELYCPYCGYKLPKGQKHCPICGKDVF